MIVEPDKAFIMGGTYRIPIVYGLLPSTFVSDLKKDTTFNIASFEREYDSRWTGTVEGAFFDGDNFDSNRMLQVPDYEASGRASKNSFYVLSMDVGRKGCQSIICVLNVTIQSTGRLIVHLVNMYDLNDTHFEELTIFLKQLFYKYNALRIVIDGNGIGMAMLDYLVKPQTLADGSYLPDFGIYNDTEGFYKKYKTKDCEAEAIYVIKANIPINTEAHVTLQSAINSNRLKFLISERDAKAKLLSTKKGQAMDSTERAIYLKPYTLTDILKEEMLNLQEKTDGVNVILDRANRGIGKDKVSALEYGLYYLAQEEGKRTKKKFNAADWLLMN